MDSLRHRPRETGPAAFSNSGRRKGRAHEDRARPDDRYGPRRLRALYEIGKLLINMTGCPEDTIRALLEILTKELPLQCAILIDKLSSEPKTVVWHASEISHADLRLAEISALASYHNLTQSSAPPVKVETKTNILKASFRKNPEKGRFILTCPLLIPRRTRLRRSSRRRG